MPFSKILSEREKERVFMRRGGSEGEAHSPLEKEPDGGLDPGTPGSQPKLKAVT